MAKVQHAGEGTNEAWGELAGEVDADDLRCHLTAKENGDGHEGGEGPEPVGAIDRGELGSGEGGESGVGESVEDEDGRDGPLDLFFHREPSPGFGDAALFLNLEFQWVQAEQHGLGQGAEERDPENGGSGEQEQGDHKPEGELAMRWLRRSSSARCAG